MAGGLIATDTFRVESGASASVTDTIASAIISTQATEIAGTLEMDHGQVAGVNLTVTSGGVLDIGIGGLAAYSNFAKLDMIGTTTLAGTLALGLIDSFVPAIGDDFDILTYGSIVGAFETVTGLDLGNGTRLALIYGASALTLRVQLEGDFDGDGFVGIADMNRVLGAWNQIRPAGAPLTGDWSGDGFVGIEDLNIVLGNWNASAPPGVDASLAIPEPGTLGLLAVGLGLLGCGRRRKSTECQRSADEVVEWSSTRSRAMRRQTRVAAMMAAGVFCAIPAQAAISFDLLPVDNSAAMTGYVTYDLQITTDVDWTATAMFLDLSAGSIYQEPEGFGQAGLTFGPPNPVWFPYFPTAEFDTYLVGDVLTTSIAGGAGDVGGDAYRFDTQALDVSWYNRSVTDIGTITIGRVTLTDDATASLGMLLTVDAGYGEESVAEFTATITPGAAPLMSQLIEQVEPSGFTPIDLGEVYIAPEAWVWPDGSDSWPFTPFSLPSLNYGDPILYNTESDDRLIQYNTNVGDRHRVLDNTFFQWEPRIIAPVQEDNLPSTLPEPGTLILVGTCLGAAMLRRR